MTRLSSRIIKIPPSLTIVKHWTGWEGVWKTILSGNSQNEVNMQQSSITCSNIIVSFSSLVDHWDWRRLFGYICVKIMKVNRFFSYPPSLGVTLSRDLDNEPVPFCAIQLGGAVALYNNVMCPFRSLQRYVGAINNTLHKERLLLLYISWMCTAISSSNSAMQSSMYQTPPVNPKHCFS